MTQPFRTRPPIAALLAALLALGVGSAARAATDEDTSAIDRPLPTIAAPPPAEEPDASSFDTEAPPPPPFDPNYRPPTAP